MKQCTKCNKEKPESEFYVRDKKTGRLHAQCKQCYQEHRRSYYDQHYRKYRPAYLARAKIRREALHTAFRLHQFNYFLGKSCELCGESDIRTFEFDHLDPSKKIFNISQAVRLGYNWEQTLNEIKKCRILCANCHKKHTATQFNWYKANGGTYRI